MKNDILERIEKLGFSYRRALKEVKRENFDNKESIRYIEGVITGIGLAHEIVQNRHSSELNHLIFNGEGLDGEQL